MVKLLQTLRKRRKSEAGNDIITSLFMIPIIVGLIFTTIDVTTYFQTRSTVQNVTRDAARTVALIGGNSATIPLNNMRKSPSVSAREQLWTGSKCTPSACSRAPSVTCTPNVANMLNQVVRCTTTYYYQPAGGALVSWLGFGDLVNMPITSVEEFRSETYYR